MPLLSTDITIDYLAESFMISHFMVATRNGTSAAGIKLPPVHGAQKGVDPALKPESQLKSKQTLLKPIPVTPGGKAANPAVGWTPSQALSSTSKSTTRSLLNTSVQSQTSRLTKTPSLTPATQNIAHQQTPVRSQLFNKSPISSAQAMSKILIQKSVRLLNAPKQKLSTNHILSSPPV